MQAIQRGFRCKLDDHINAAQEVTIDITVAGSGVYDYTCFGVDSNNKLPDERYMVFYNQTNSPNNEIVLSQNGNTASYRIQLAKLPTTVQKLAFTISIDGNGTMRDISKLSVQIKQSGKMKLSLDLIGNDFQQEKAVIAIEIYRKEVWRFAAVAAGFNGGLPDLLKHYGGEEEEVVPVPPKPSEKISLSKITLDKLGDKHSINLSKNSGEIVINLNWTQQLQKGGIDLDLGVFYELRNGSRHVIDGLQFSQGRGGPRNRRTNQGCYTQQPWIWHSGDDRSGSISEGENIFINPQGISDLKRIIVYCFIYQGVARWIETNAVVTVKVPGNPDIVIEMGKQNDSRTTCAIAEIDFEGSNLMTVKKLITFHNGHRDCDIAYDWKMTWGRGNK
jgi:tellurite resistance protein TerA